MFIAPCLKLLVFVSVFFVALGENGTASPSGPLITGGTDEHNRDYSRSIVSLRRGDPQTCWGDNHYCAGTLVSADVVLTAAHCVFDPQTNEQFSAHDLTVVSGLVNRFQQTADTIESRVRKITPHEHYSHHIPIFDIAILKLEKRIGEDPRQRVQIMPMNQSPLEAKMRCTTLGWGRVVTDGPTSAILLYANVTVWPLLECKMKYVFLFVFPGAICANDEDDPHLGADACQGDSGGPMVCNEQLAGIVSFGLECGKKGYPGAYTDVYYYRRWIEKNSAIASKRSSYTVVMVTMLLNKFVR